jgi:hypothetical protein
MLEKYGLWIVVGLAAVWFLFLRKTTAVTGGANLSIATGNNATPYSGYPPGQVPPGVPVGGGYSGAAPPPQPQIIYQQGGASSNSDAAWLSAAGNFLAGAGQAAGSIMTGLVNSGLIGGSSNGGGGSYGSGYDTSGGGGGIYDD